MTSPEKKLTDTVFEQKSAIEDVYIKLEKAKTLLDHLKNEYSFSDNPDPYAAIATTKRGGNVNDLKGMQSHKWFYDYNTITTFIEIVSDYVNDSENILEKAMQKPL